MTDIPGMYILKEFITEEEEKELIDEIDSLEWSNELNRRTQQYGYKYDYKSREVEGKAEEMPDKVAQIAKKITKHALMDMPNQCIINEYEPGQGITAHTDHKSFGPVITTLSLLSAVKFNMKGAKNKSFYIKPRTLVVLSGDSRFKYKHSIDSVKYDDIMLKSGEVNRIYRNRRISVTFRTF
jgi:alkylated DNA repair dioxygenase AlkB